MCQGQSTPYIGEFNHPTFNDGNPDNRETPTWRKVDFPMNYL